MVELQMSAGSLEMLERAVSLARTLIELPFEPNLWQAQNIWYEILRHLQLRAHLSTLPTTGPLGEKLQPARHVPLHRHEAIRADDQSRATAIVRLRIVIAIIERAPPSFLRSLQEGRKAES